VERETSNNLCHVAGRDAVLMKFAGLGGNGIIHLERSSAIATVGCRIR
jgi:hypothetical protein